MLNQVEITSAIQNIFDLWTSIEDQESTFDRLPILSDAYRDAELNWEADFIQWMIRNERKPTLGYVGNTWSFDVEERTVEMPTSQEIMTGAFLKPKNKPRLSLKIRYRLPIQFKYSDLAIQSSSEAKCYYMAIMAFMSLAEEQRQQVLDTACLAD